MRKQLDQLLKENKKISIGWLVHDNNNPFVNGFSRNLFEYYYVLLQNSKFQQFVGVSEEDLQIQSDGEGFETVLIIRQGIVFPNIDNFMEFINEQDFEDYDIVLAENYREYVLDFNKTNTANMSELIKILNTEVSFVANTDNAEIAKQYMPKIHKTFSKIITSSGGLNPILYPYALNMSEGATVELRDISNIGLLNAKRWITEWDGTDCSSFVKKLIDSTSVDGTTWIVRGGKHKQTMQDLLDQQEGFSEWFKNVFPTINYKYIHHDFFNGLETRDLVGDLENTEGNIYIHLSNIFHYQATAFYYNLEDRIACLNDLITRINNSGLGDRVMMTFMDPQMLLVPQPRWVKNIPTAELQQKYRVFPWQK
jgi:hypothetical protein